MTSIPWKQTLLVTLAAGMGVASLVVAATLSLRLQERIGLVQAVRDLRRQVSLVGTALREAEAAQRMYVITGDEAHHVMFAAVREAFPARWKALEAAQKAGEGHQMDLNALRASADQALASLEETAAVRRARGRDAAMEQVESGRSETQLSAVHLQLEAVTEQLEQRTAEETRSLALAEARGRAASIGAGVVALAVGALGVWQWWWSLRQYRRELELAAEKRRAEQMARDKGEFLAAMSHEVRTPLNTIVGMSEQLCAELAAGPPAEWAGAVRTAARTMLRLVNDLLDLSRLEAGGQELVPSAVAVAAELEWLGQILGPQASSAGVTIDLSAAEDLPPVLWLDEGRFRQILLNLASNGLKFTPRGGRVQVRLERSESAAGPELVLEVKDTGIGIPPEEHARIFQPYVQALGAPTVQGTQGAGLGLAIVRQLVDLMGGAISLQSRPGSGAVFRVLLPLREPPGATAVIAAPQVRARRLADEAADPAPGIEPVRLHGALGMRLHSILDGVYPAAVSTHSTDDVQRLAEALDDLGRDSGCTAFGEEAARLRAASASFALEELSDALTSLGGRLSAMAPGPVVSRS